MPLYNATITTGPLMLPESRRIAALLMRSPTKADWNHAIRIENILQKNTPSSANRISALIRSRLTTLPASAWPLVAEGPHECAVQTLFAAAIFHSRLVRDFLLDVVAKHHRRLDTNLKKTEWEAFLAECASRDPSVAKWSEATRAKLFQVVVRMLVEVRYLESPKTLRLRRPGLVREVRLLLRNMGEQELIKVLEPDA